MSEWEKKTLGEVINLKRGYDLPQSQRSKGDIPIYSSSGISGFHDKYKALNPGVITGRYGTIGNIYFANAPYWPLNTTLYVEDFKGNNEVFVYYFLKQIDWARFSDKSAVPGVNRNDVHKENIWLPSLPIQKKIAAILSCLDRKIENLRKQNETLEEIARSIFKHWFIDFEFPNADGKPYKSSGGVMVRSELGDIPEGWHVGISGELIRLQGGYAFKSDDFQLSGENRVIKIRNISNNVIDINKTDFISDSIASKTNSRFKLSSGDVLIAMTGAEVAKIGVVPETKEPLLLNQRVGAFQEKVNGGKIYIYYLFCREEYQRLLRDRGSGSSAQPNISSSDIEGITITIPVLSIIEEFNKTSNSLFIKRCKNMLQIQTLTRTRDTLLPKLMSGQLRVEE
jgi:type I restriction enzyme S subunit